MTRQEYADKCVKFVAVLREAAQEDQTLALFLMTQGMLVDPVFDGELNG